MIPYKTIIFSHLLSPLSLPIILPSTPAAEIHPSPLARLQSHCTSGCKEKFCPLSNETTSATFNSYTETVYHVVYGILQPLPVKPFLPISVKDVKNRFPFRKGGREPLCGFAMSSGVAQVSLYRLKANSPFKLLRSLLSVVVPLVLKADCCFCKSLTKFCIVIICPICFSIAFNYFIVP